jgi:hypothetical protein
VVERTDLAEVLGTSQKIGGAAAGQFRSLQQRHQTTACTTLARCTTLDLRATAKTAEPCHLDRGHHQSDCSIMSILACPFWARRDVAAWIVTSLSVLECSSARLPACHTLAPTLTENASLETSQAWGLFPVAQCRDGYPLG